MRPLPLALLLLLVWPSASLATYTGLQDSIDYGPVVTGGGWAVVPAIEESSDPGTITGEPSANLTTYIGLAKIAGSGKLRFRSLELGTGQATTGPFTGTASGPALASGWSGGVSLAWPTPAGISSATLSGAGTLTNPLSFGAGAQEPLTLDGGPDGSYAVQWGDSAAIVGAGQATAPATTTLPAGESLTLAGAGQSWPVSASGVGGVAGPVLATVGDASGDLFTLTGAGVSRIEPGVAAAVTQPLPAGAADAMLAAGFVVYREPNCRTYVQAFGAPPTRIGSRCSTPIAVTSAGASAFVVLRFAKGLTVATVRAGRVVLWPGALGGTEIAAAAVNASEVLVETRGKAHDDGEQCGGADDSTSTPYTVRLLRGAHVLRTGSLSSSVYNC